MHIPKDFTINTERLLLRIPHLEDIPFIVSATRFEGFNDGMLWEPPASGDELIAPFEKNIIAWENNSAFSFTITSKNSSSLIGRISIRQEPEKNVWNIGFWTHPDFQNKGYMSESTLAIFSFGFTKLHAERIIANHAIWNKASEQVLKKCGMTFKQYIEKGFLKHGKWVDENQLEITKQDWLKSNTP